MTWIVAVPSVFGFAVAISDIRVTHANGRVDDCLQKIFHVGNDVAVGFAGDVRFGFALTQSLAEICRSLPSPSAWNPEQLMVRWQRAAADLAQDFKPDERDAELIVLTIHPSENIGDSSLPKPYVYTMSAPFFAPTLAAIGTVVSIGSGATHLPFAEALDDIGTNPFYRQMIDFPNGIQMAMAHRVASTVEKFPNETVSRYVHMCSLHRGGAWIAPYRRRDLTGSGADDLVMPPVAKNYADFITGRTSAALATRSIA